MKLGLILVAFFLIVSALYAMYSFYGANDVGFILAFVVGLVGSVLALGLVKFRSAKALGEGMIGLALFFMIANLFGVPLVA
jgi:hypothetical protein